MINWYLSFLYGNIPHGKVASETNTFGWVWPVEPLLQSDCKILWSSISDRSQKVSLIFLHGVSYQGELESDSITLVAFGQKCLVSNQIVGFFDQYIWKESIVILYFFHMRIIIKGIIHFWLDVISCASRPIRLQDSLINKISIRNHNILDFLHGDVHQVKVEYKATTFIWKMLDLPLIQCSQKNIDIHKSTKISGY